MKTRLLIISVISFGILFSLIPAFALIISHTPEELYEIYDIIIFGEILDYTDVGTSSLYDVQVIRYLKNPQPNDIIQVIGSGAHGKGIWVEDSTVFEIGERAVLYIEREQNNTLRVGPYSFSTHLDIDNPYWYYPYRWIILLGSIVGIIGFVVWRKRK